MTGPEHYRAAEGLLDSLSGKGRGEYPSEASIAAEAQVHATLALAAATALRDLSMADGHQWLEIAATR